jgi:hypothetical protein
MGYSKGIVCYIDILGSKDRTFEDSLKISTIFHDELENVQRRHRETSVGNRFVTSFSDCAYIIYKIKDENNKQEILLPYIYTSLYNTANTVAFFVGNGFLCRGGIAFGDLYFDGEKNIVFGPAITESYSLEQKAKMPRIIFSDELAEKINIYDKEIKAENELASRINGEIILKDDIDQRYYLNYLNPFIGAGSVGLGNTSFQFNSYYYNVKNNSLNIIENELDHDIIAKHNWHLNYLESIKNKVDNYQEITAEEIIKYHRKGL